MRICNYQASKGKVDLICLCLLYEWLNLVPCKVASVVVSPDDSFDDLALVAHLRHDLGLLSFHAGRLHGGKDFRLLPLGNTTEPHS